MPYRKKRRMDPEELRDIQKHTTRHPHTQPSLTDNNPRQPNGTT